VTTPTLKYKAFYGDYMTIICEVFGQPEVTNVNWHITTQAGSIDFSGSKSARYDESLLPDLRFVFITQCFIEYTSPVRDSNSQR
jgi:hypothetical protein